MQKLSIRIQESNSDSLRRNVKSVIHDFLKSIDSRGTSNVSLELHNIMLPGEFNKFAFDRSIPFLKDNPVEEVEESYDDSMEVDNPVAEAAAIRRIETRETQNKETTENKLNEIMGIWKTSQAFDRHIPRRVYDPHFGDGKPPPPKAPIPPKDTDPDIDKMEYRARRLNTYRQDATAKKTNKWLFEANTSHEIESRRSFCYRVSFLQALLSPLEEKDYLAKEMEKLARTGYSRSKAKEDAKSDFVSREALIGLILRSQITRSWFPSFHTISLDRAPRLIHAYCALVSDFTYSSYSSWLLKDLMIRNFRPSLCYARELPKFHPYPSYNYNPLLCESEWETQDETFVCRAFLSPVVTLVNGFCELVLRDLKKDSKILAMQTYKYRYFLMLGTQWMRFIQLAGLRFVETEHFKTRIRGEEIEKYLTQAYESEDKESPDFTIGIFAGLIVKLVFESGLFKMHKTLEDYIKDYVIRNNKGKVKHGDAPVRKQCNGVNGNYMKETFLHFEFIPPKLMSEQAHAYVQRIDRWSLFQCIEFILLGKVYAGRSGKAKPDEPKEDGKPKEPIYETMDMRHSRDPILDDMAGVVFLDLAFREQLFSAFRAPGKVVEAPAVDHGKALRGLLFNASFKYYKTELVKATPGKDSEKEPPLDDETYKKSPIYRARQQKRFQVISQELLRTSYYFETLSAAIHANSHNATNDTLYGFAEKDFKTGFDNSFLENSITQMREKLSTGVRDLVSGIPDGDGGSRILAGVAEDALAGNKLTALIDIMKLQDLKPAADPTAGNLVHGAFLESTRPEGQQRGPENENRGAPARAPAPAPPAAALPVAVAPKGQQRGPVGASGSASSGDPNNETPAGMTVPPHLEKITFPGDWISIDNENYRKVDCIMVDGEYHLPQNCMLVGGRHQLRVKTENKEDGDIKGENGGEGPEDL